MSELEQAHQRLILEYKTAENEWKKEKAILQQKLEIMDLQLQEAKNRELNLKKMNEAFMSSIQENKQEKSGHNLIKEFQRSFESNQKDCFESKMRMQDFIKNLEQKIKDQDQLLHDKELEIKDIQGNKEREIMNLQNQCIELQAQKQLCDHQISKLLADAKYKKEINQYEMSNQIKELNSQINHLKNEHKKELEKLKCQQDIQIKKLRYQSLQKRQEEQSDGGETQKSKISLKQKQTQAEEQFKEERKKLKAQICSQETQIKLLKEKIQQVTKQLDIEKEQNQKLIDNINFEHQQREQSLKNENVQLSSLLEEELIKNQRLSRDELKSSVSIQSPCHPTARVMLKQQFKYNNSQKTNARPSSIFEDCTLNPQKVDQGDQNKENYDPDVSQFSTNNTKFKVNDLIQKASIGLIENVNFNNTQAKLQDQIATIFNKLHEAKKKITQSTIEENSYIRQSMQKIKHKNKNHSLSINDQSTILKDLDIPQPSFLEDSFENRSRPRYRI